MYTLYSMQRSGNSYKVRLALAQLAGGPAMNGMPSRNPERRTLGITKIQRALAGLQRMGGIAIHAHHVIKREHPSR